MRGIGRPSGTTDIGSHGFVGGVLENLPAKLPCHLPLHRNGENRLDAGRRWVPATSPDPVTPYSIGGLRECQSVTFWKA